MSAGSDAEELDWEISVSDAKSILEQTAAVLLDCREQAEFDFVRLPDSILLPTSRLGQGFETLEALRDRRILVLCHHGVRSLGVTRLLRRHGFSQVQSIAGGIDAWAAEIDPSLPRY